ncbi:mitofilin family membrane protein [uncultured Shimia sp.]|mgnify:CR=1 FL=1|uniref:COG4223 family protein n=1 Tax=uncultured Shimia sp. TaxID=573152 RepID=UPI0025E44D2F|nr:mitofilin family membrane protein [uncultured Shimia sp.]
MGTTDKSDKPSKDQVDQQDQTDTQADAEDVVEDAEIVEESAQDSGLEDGTSGDAAEDESDEAPVEIEEPGSEETAEHQSDVTEAVEKADDKAPVEGSDAATPAPGAQEQERKGGFVPMVLGGVVAACIGFGGAVYFGDQLGLGAGTEAALTEMTAKLEAQNETLVALNERLSATSDVSGGAREAADHAAAEVTKITEVLSAYTTQLGSVSEAVSTLEARLTDIEKRPLNEGLGAAAIAAYEREVKDLRDLVSAQKAEASELKDKADLSAKAALARSSVTRIVAALDSGAPYRAAVVDLRSSTGEGIAPVLEDHADHGVVTLAALLESYPDAAREALAKAREDKVDAGTGNKLGNFLKTQFGARSVEAREGTDTDAVLSRAEAALKAGDLSAALAELDTLAEGPKTVMAEWVAQAQTRAAATQAAEELAQTLNSN